MITPKSEKLEKLKNNYKIALQKEKKSIEKELINFSKNVVEISIKNEKFFNDFSKLLNSDDYKKLQEQYTKIIGMYKWKFYYQIYKMYSIELQLIFKVYY